MSVKKEATIQRFIGLSSDTKPTSVPVGSTFYAYDIGCLYITHDGTNYVIKPQSHQPLTYTEIVNCSGGGVAQTEALTTLGAGSVIQEIVCNVTETFDGNAVKTFEVGIVGNTDKYIDPVDCPVTSGQVMTMTGGTNNDQKTPEALAAGTALIATWTNNAAATAGRVIVTIIYY